MQDIKQSILMLWDKEFVLKSILFGTGFFFL